MKRQPLSSLINDIDQCTPEKFGRPQFTYLDISSVDNATKRLRNPQRINVEAAPSRARQLVHTDDVLVSTVRPNLNAVALVPARFDSQIASTGFCVLRSQPKRLCPQYLFYFTQSRAFVTHLTTIATGASYPAVTESNILDTCIPLPEVFEQRRIARQLAQADRLRRTRRYAQEISDTLLPAAFVEFFGDPITNSLGIPVSELGDFLSFVTSGSRGWADYYAPKGNRFIRSLDVQMNGISDEDAVFVKAPLGAEADRTRVKPADVLLTITGSRIGRVASVPERLNGAFISQHVAILRLKAGLLAEFLSVFLSLQTGGQRQIASLQYGQTKPGLNLDQIREFRIPVPDISRQVEFVAVVKRVERLCSMEREAFRQAEHLFQTLLHRTFAETD
jgi:type I restriction enzyme, S subunit